MSLYFPNDPHPTAILLLISSVLSFSIFTNCPKYTYSSTFSTSSPPTWTSFLLTYSLYITLVFSYFFLFPAFCFLYLIHSAFLQFLHNYCLLVQCHQQISDGLIILHLSLSLCYPS